MCTGRACCVRWRARAPGYRTGQPQFGSSAARRLRAGSMRTYRPRDVMIMKMRRERKTGGSGLDRGGFPPRDRCCVDAALPAARGALHGREAARTVVPAPQCASKPRLLRGSPWQYTSDAGAQIRCLRPWLTTLRSAAPQAAVAQRSVASPFVNARMELRVGKKYRLSKKIGGGSFGDIFHGGFCGRGHSVCRFFTRRQWTKRGWACPK